MINFAERFGSAVRVARQYNGSTQRELADKLNICRHHLAEIEGGHKKPSYDLLFSLVFELNLQLDPIFHPDLIQFRTEILDILTLLQDCNDQEVSTFYSVLRTIVEYREVPVTSVSGI